jgi:hypothetical protein
LLHSPYLPPKYPFLTYFDYYFFEKGLSFHFIGKSTFCHIFGWRKPEMRFNKVLFPTPDFPIRA